MFCWVWGDCPVPLGCLASSLAFTYQLPPQVRTTKLLYTLTVRSQWIPAGGISDYGEHGRAWRGGWLQLCSTMLWFYIYIYIYICIQMTKIIFLIYLDKVLAHSSQPQWNLLSDKSNGSICVHVPAPSASLDSVRISIYSWLHLRIWSARFIHSTFYLRDLKICGFWSLWGLLKPAAPHPQAQPCWVSRLRFLTHFREQVKCSSCYPQQARFYHTGCMLMRWLLESTQGGELVARGTKSA